MTDNPSIIAELRNHLGESQEEFAKRLGDDVTSQNVSDLERGKGKFKTTYLFKLLHVIRNTADIQRLFALAGFNSYGQSVLAEYLGMVYPTGGKKARDGPARYLVGEDLAPRDGFERDLIKDLLGILRSTDQDTKTAIAQNVRQFSKLVAIDERLQQLEEIIKKAGLVRPEEKKKTGS